MLLHRVVATQPYMHRTKAAHAGFTQVTDFNLADNRVAWFAGVITDTTGCSQDDAGGSWSRHQVRHLERAQRLYRFHDFY